MPFVYLATDDSAECLSLATMPAYANITCHLNGSFTAGVTERYSRLSLLNLLTDVFLLAECEVLVGTFSSQVSRLAYELAQTIRRPIDSRAASVSLDDGWYYSG